MFATSIANRREPVHRELLAWGALAFAILHWTHVSFAAFSLGGIVTFVIVTIDHVSCHVSCHVKRRRLRRSIVRGGQILEPPS